MPVTRLNYTMPGQEGRRNPSWHSPAFLRELLTTRKCHALHGRAKVRYLAIVQTSRAAFGPGGKEQLDMARLSMNEMTTFRWSFEEDVAQYAAAGFSALGVWRQKLSDFGEETGIE